MHTLFGLEAVGINEKKKSTSLMYKIKSLFTICLPFVLFNAMGQTKTYQFKYIDREGKKAGLLTLNYKAFRFDYFLSVIKIEKTGRVYELVRFGKGKYGAIRKPAGRSLANEVVFGYWVEPGKVDTIIKTDTVYYKSDSVIAGLKCRKVGLNYVENTISNEKAHNINNRDTVKAFVWVSAIQQQDGLFNFTSKELNGLILRFEQTRNRPHLESHTCYTAVATGNKVFPTSIFELPKPCIMYTDQHKFDECIGNLLAKKVALMLKNKD
jgi:hypothetical protein